MKITLCILFLGMTIALRAEPFVRWHGTYITSNTPAVKLNLKDGISFENGIIYPSQDMTPSSLAYDKTASSAIFHGVVQLINESTAGDMEDAMNQVRSKDGGATREENVIFLSTSPGIKGGHCNASGIVFWIREGDPLRMTDISEFLLESPSRFDGKHARFAVRSHGQWYLSEESMEGRDAQELRLSNPADARWQKWDFQPDNPPLPPPPEVFEIAGRELNEIEAIGLYFDVTYKATSRAAFSIKKFQVQ